MDSNSIEILCIRIDTFGFKVFKDFGMGKDWY